MSFFIFLAFYLTFYLMFFLAFRPACSLRNFPHSLRIRSIPRSIPLPGGRGCVRG